MRRTGFLEVVFVGFALEGAANASKLQAWIYGLLRHMDERLYRFKGVIAVKNISQSMCTRATVRYSADDSRMCVGQKARSVCAGSRV